MILPRSLRPALSRVATTGHRGPTLCFEKLSGASNTLPAQVRVEGEVMPLPTPLSSVPEDNAKRGDRPFRLQIDGKDRLNESTESWTPFCAVRPDTQAILLCFGAFDAGLERVRHLRSI